MINFFFAAEQISRKSAKEGWGKVTGGNYHFTKAAEHRREAYGGTPDAARAEFVENFLRNRPATTPLR